MCIRDRGSTAHLLDVLATSRPAIVNDVKVSDADFLSDHRLVSATVATRVVKPVVTRASRNIRSIDTAKFDSALRQSELFSRPATTVDSFVEQLDAVLTRLLDDMAPVRLRRRRDPKPTSKWLSDDAIASKRRRRRLERRWRKSGAEADRQIYRRACREANQLINQSRSDYYRQRIESVGADCRKRWKVVRELLHHNDRGATRQDDENRNLCHTFSNYFVDKICRLQSTVRNKLHMLNIVSAAGSSDLPYSGPGFSAISPVTAAEVLKLLHSAPPKSSRMDTVPTSLLLAVSETFSEIIAYLANLSFSEGRFPTKFKSASVTPLLKSDHLDKTAPASYRPISNLNFISKILERLFLQRFQPHILASPNFNKHQSAYRPGHSTETALLLLLDNIFHAADSGKSTLLVSLDLSAAFDTIEHSTLLQRLIYSFGVTGTALSWIKCYLTDRNQSVCIGQYSSPVVPCSVGVPQGSVLGPLLFSIYTSSIAAVAQSHGVLQQQYADDTQLYIALTSSDPSCELAAIQSCLTSLQVWFYTNGMALNPDKSHAILFGTAQRAQSFSGLQSIDVAGSATSLVSHIKLLGRISRLDWRLCAV